jgi:hypothetical protein
MHPVWVIRASCTAFALRSNRELASNVSHKRSSSNIIFYPLLRPIPSTLICSIRNPSSTPSRRPLPTRLNYPLNGNFLIPGCPLGRIRPRCSSAPFSLHWPPLSKFLSPDRVWLPSLRTRWAPAIHASLNFSPQRNTQQQR